MEKYPYILEVLFSSSCQQIMTCSDSKMNWSLGKDITQGQGALYYYIFIFGSLIFCSALTNCYQLSKMDKVSFFYKEEKHLVMPHTRWPLSSFMWAESIHSCFSSSENYLALCLNIFLLRDQFLYECKLWKMKA